MKRFTRTSESVNEVPPDKLADQIVDAILDEILENDPDARVACEAALTRGLVLLFGEITTAAHPSYVDVARRTICEVGYEGPRWGFDGHSCAVVSAFERQSPDISRGVDATGEKELGAGDQGIMIGYACSETAELMPAPIHYAHALTRGVAGLRKRGELDYLGPDGKAQVTVEYSREGTPERVRTVLVSTQHTDGVDARRIEEDFSRCLFPSVCPPGLLDERTRILVNPTGRFVVGGPPGDSGLSGRKIIVDAYGEAARHGGGAFSGKDPTKVDRCGAYMARCMAKHVVAAGFADRCEVQLAYAIGIPDPLAVEVNTFDTGEVDEGRLAAALRDVFPLKPAGIIEALGLRRPIYRRTACYGHFGHLADGQGAYPWERLDRLDELRRALG